MAAAAQAGKGIATHVMLFGRLRIMMLVPVAGSLATSLPPPPLGLGLFDLERRGGESDMLPRWLVGLFLCLL